MKKKMMFLAFVMIGLLLTTTACGKKKNNSGNNQGNTPVVTPSQPQGLIANTNEGVIYETVIDGLKISNVSLISEDGAAVYSATVTNTNESDVLVQSFNVIMKDADGNVIIALLGFVGNTLAPGASTTITNNVFMDITQVASIEYTRNY